MTDPASPSPVSTRRYRQVSLGALLSASDVRVDGAPAIEKLPFLPESVLDVPPFIRGNIDLDWRGRRPPQPERLAAGRLTRPAIDALLIREAVVHGRTGIVTFADRILSQSLYQVPLHAIEGAARLPDGSLTLPERPLAASVADGYHLLAGNPDNYFHWLIDALVRFRPELLRDMARLTGAGLTGAATPPVLLVPECSTLWQRDSLALAIPRGAPRIALYAEGCVRVERLLYVPDLSGGTLHPHPALLALFDRLRDEHAGIPPPSWRPWRRIYVSRADSDNRRLLNEAAVAACAERAGFTVVTLSGMTVAAQIRLFAQASHIVAPHGAGLTNIGFCSAGASLLELHMDSYPHWAFRRMAALRGLRYDCVLGTTQEPRHDWPHHDSWTLDVDELEAVLMDQRFLAG